MQPKLRELRTIILLVFFSCMSIVAQGQEPSVFTDRKDYSPGDTILIQGAGWLAGENVELNIVHSKVSYGYYTLYAVVDEDGHFYSKEMVMQQIHKGESFILTATGLTSGAAAQTIFTDGTFNSRTSGDWNSVDTWTVSRAGTINTNGASAIVTGNDTKFVSELSLGDILTTANDSFVLGKVKSIESDVLLTLEANAGQSSSGGGISYAARKVPGAEDNVVINGHTIAVSHSVRCLNLNLYKAATLTVRTNVSLDISDSLTLSNSGSASYNSLLEGEGTINTGYLNLGDNSNAIEYGTFWHTLKTTVSYFNIIQDVAVRSFQGKTTVRNSNGRFLAASGKVTIGGSVFIYNERDENEVVFSLREAPGAATLALNGRYKTFIYEYRGTRKILLDGAASTVEYTRDGDQIVFPGMYKNITLNGSGVKDVSLIEVYGRLSMQGSATAIASSQPKYMSSAELEYKGITHQTTGGEFPSSINNLIINNASGVTLNGGDRIINGVLTLSDGILSTGTSKVRMWTYGSIKEASEKSYVSGKLEQECKALSLKEFPIGEGGFYRPVKLEFTSLSGNVRFLVEQVEEPLSGVLPANTLLAGNHYWRVVPSGTSTFKCNLTVTDPSVTFSQGTQTVILKKNSAIESLDPEVNETSYTVMGLTTLGDFSLGKRMLWVPTSTSVTNASVIYGDTQVDIVATVSAQDGSPVIGGTIDFHLREITTYNTRSIGRIPVDQSGVATLTYDPHLLNAGSYTIVASYSGYEMFEGSSSNLPEPGSNGVLTIETRPITVTANVTRKIYGDRSPELTYQVSRGNLVGLDNFSGALTREEGESVGTYSIAKGSLSLNENYDLEFVGAEFVISKRPITVSAIPQQKFYGGNDPVLIYDVSNGNLVAGDVFRGLLSRTVGEEVGSYVIDQGTFTAGDNYELTFINSSLTIEPAPASVEVADLSKIYNGLPQEATVKTMPAGLAVVVTYDGSATAPTDAGFYTVEVVLANSNYKLVNDQGTEMLKQIGTLVINSRALSITVNNKGKVYGTDNPALDGMESGLVSSDGISVSYNTSAQTTSNVGAYPITATISDPNNKLGNYTVSNASGKLTITPAPATIVLSSLAQTYDGTVKFATATATPAEAGTSVKYFREGSAVEVPIAAGSYNIEAVLTNSNYEAKPVSGMLVIAKATTTVTMNVSDGIYDSKPHRGTALVSGADGLNQALAVTYTGMTMAGVSYSSDEPPTEAGEYFATANYAGSDNYLESSDSKHFTIAKSTSIVNLKDIEVLFDGSPHPTTAFVEGITGMIDDAKVTYSYVGTPNGAPENSYNSLDAPTLDGNYMVKASFSGNNNYNGDDATAIIRIYAIPKVSLSTPSPVAINNTSAIKANLGYDVHNVQWHCSNAQSITTGSILNSAEFSIKSSTPNVYSVYVTFEDGLGNQGYLSDNVYAVFYDPAAGFVTGGGWVNSPAGAYAPNETLTGKANFGFVSKYEKGKTIPSGNTEFQFQAGGMNFKSNEYEYLVVAGARAQFKGKGTVNGTGSYGFMLSAVDENLLGSGLADKFRIKIWDNNDGGKVIYDNQMNAGEDALPTTAIGGGSIVIHTPGSGGKKTNAIAGDARVSEPDVPTKFILKAFPNPSTSHFNLRVEGDGVEDKITLRIVDLNGRVIEMIHNASPGQTYSVGKTYRPGVYLVQIIQGSLRSQAMLLKVAE